MITTKAHGSLCHHDLSAGELRGHRKRGMHELVQYTINMIKARHPEWAEHDPVCQKCWDYYQKLPAE